jgi:predicted Zn-ribbon and HTH transcriptional regulator
MKLVPRIDEYGRITSEPDTSGMFAPGRCKRCGHVHDSGPVTVVARYSDCSVWHCPSCNSLIDDRPIGWGGSFEPITARR